MDTNEAVLKADKSGMAGLQNGQLGNPKRVFNGVFRNLRGINIDGSHCVHLASVGDDSFMLQAFTEDSFNLTGRFEEDFM